MKKIPRTVSPTADVVLFAALESADFEESEATAAHLRSIITAGAMIIEARQCAGLGK